ncbi:MAG: lipoyl(octanoyl) transferase LipB [Anaerolineales bacterium]|nr:lipoyl(octanoyl) transferase LipB [Anaerolineales bacterium]
MICKVYRLGEIPYQAAWDLQNQLAGEVAAGTSPPALLLLQHPHTYTFGSRGQAENLLWDEAELERRGINVHWVDRGGDVTYHGPGQLVGYPIIPLGTANLEINADGKARLPQPDYVGYLRKLEAVIIRALFRLGIAAGQVPGQTGVWLSPDVVSRCKTCPIHLKQQPAKIASIGVKVDARGITRHGFALNVAPDMRYWEGIIACGLENANPISLEYFLDPLPEMDTLMDIVTDQFGAVFDFALQKVETAPSLYPPKFQIKA